MPRFKFSLRIVIGLTAAIAAVAGLLVLLNLKEIIKASPQYFGYRGNDLFGVYTAQIDGSHCSRLLSDAKRELTHARLSPDKSRMTLTRYNRVLGSGLAEENGSDYLNTEILIANADGTGLRSVTKTGATVMNANSSWIDNDHLIFVHSPDICTTLAELRVLDLTTNKDYRLPTPEHQAVADPTVRNGLVGFPLIDTSTKPNACNPLWMMNLSGKNLTQLTKPVITEAQAPLLFRLGDYDPWLAPDGKSVVFMRYRGGTDWRIYSINLDTKEERELTPPHIPCGIPKWSNDGQSIVYVCWDNSDLKNLGLYLMQHDGTSRHQIALPAGYLYTHPSFVPETGGASTPQIIFSARKVPALPGSPAKK